jgi:uncharacterized protein YukE
MADHIVYQHAPIGDAVIALQGAASATEVNHQRSLHTVTANADNFGGQGSVAFHEAIARVNAIYAQSQEDIQAASRALDLAKIKMIETDGQMAAQY